MTSPWRTTSLPMRVMPSEASGPPARCPRGDRGRLTDAWSASCVSTIRSTSIRSCGPEQSSPATVLGLACEPADAVPRMRHRMPIAFHALSCAPEPAQRTTCPVRYDVSRTKAARLTGTPPPRTVPAAAAPCPSRPSLPHGNPTAVVHLDREHIEALELSKQPSGSGKMKRTPHRFASGFSRSFRWRLQRAGGRDHGAL